MLYSGTVVHLFWRCCAVPMCDVVLRRSRGFTSSPTLMGGWTAASACRCGVMMYRTVLMLYIIFVPPPPHLPVVGRLRLPDDVVLSCICTAYLPLIFTSSLPHSHRWVGGCVCLPRSSRFCSPGSRRSRAHPRGWRYDYGLPRRTRLSKSGRCRCVVCKREGEIALLTPSLGAC